MKTFSFEYIIREEIFNYIILEEIVDKCLQSKGRACSWRHEKILMRKVLPLENNKI